MSTSPATRSGEAVETRVGNRFIANYPPFSTWTAEEIPALDEALDRPPRPGPLSVYVHLPFCRQRCHYCYFRVYARRASPDVRRYVDGVLAEAGEWSRRPALRGRAPVSVYFGGGTPSYLQPDEIRHLLGGLREVFSWDAVEECTVECEPGTVTPAKLEALREMGATRLSLGVQSLDPDTVRRVGREQPVEDVERAVGAVRDAGFDELNIDLLVGLPGETDALWDRTVRGVAELSPDCVTIYQLELTHNSSLHALRRAGREIDLPGWDVKRARTGRAFRELESAGYTVASAYMAVRDPARWRFVYTVESFWRGADLLGLGESSFGHLQGMHYQNADSFEGYLGAVEAGRLPLQRARRVRSSEAFRRRFMLLLKTGDVDRAEFRRDFGRDPARVFAPELASLERRGLAQVAGDHVRLTREGLLRVDELLPAFYLPEHRSVRYW